MVVTATQGGNTANGLALRVKVLTSVAAVQNGAAATLEATSPTPCETSITTTVTGSRVYGAAFKGANTSFTADALTTVIDNVADATNGNRYGTFKATSATGTPGATTLGFSSPASGDFTDVALLEVLPNGTITEDASAPAVASTTSATTVSTASFNPPDGALLVAMVSSNGAAGGAPVSMGVAGGGISWSELSSANGAGTPGGAGYAGVWVAVAGSAPADDPVVTATMSGASAQAGMYLLVKVLTGAVEAGGTAAGGNSLTGATAQGSITPAATNSKIMFGLSADNVLTLTGAAANNTYYDNAGNATNTWAYAHGDYTGTVTAATPVTYGAGTATGDHSNWAAYEVKPSAGATPAVDGSSPPLVTTDALQTISTALFSPPSGSVLVAIVVAGGTGTGAGITMTVSSAPAMTWTQRSVSAASDNFQPVFIFTATVGADQPRRAAQPGKTWLRRFHHRQQPPAAQAPAAATIVATANLNGAGAVTATTVQTAGASLAGAGAVTAAAQSGSFVVVTYTGAGAGTFVPPAGVTLLSLVECWGSGGGSSGGGGSGGGGGAYAAITGFACTPGNSYSLTVAAGGTAGGTGTAGGAGNPSSFNTSSCIAAGGDLGPFGAGPAAGGTTAASTGTVKFAGGASGSAAAGTGGSGGGASGGSAAAGNAGANSSGSTSVAGGTAVTGGGFR
jgi:hypothetical protein